MKDSLGRSVIQDTIIVGGVDSDDDYPDFADAFITWAEYTTGDEVGSTELDYLTDHYGMAVNAKAYEGFVETRAAKADAHRDMEL